MTTPKSIASCQMSFVPIGEEGYAFSVKRVLNMIKDSGLDYQIGALSTVVVGETEQILELISNVYRTMESEAAFVLDVRLSNVCGCGK